MKSLNTFCVRKKKKRRILLAITSAVAVAAGTYMDDFLGTVVMVC
jgi:hypothetical protein